MPLVLRYFAYGSNMLPSRLRERVPSARPLGPASLRGYRLTFDKPGQDDSGKCSIAFTGSDADRLWGVLYTLRASEKPLLDAAEGPAYECREMTVRLQRLQVTAFLYEAIAPLPDQWPWHWYRGLVLAGALSQGLPRSSVSPLRAQVSAADPDLRRSLRHQRLLRAERSARRAVAYTARN